MDSKSIARICADNPMLYREAPAEDLEQLYRIAKLYPDNVRLLSDREAVELPAFDCRRCGTCCSAIKYITVSGQDVKRWVRQRRWDIIDGLVIDRRKTPLLAKYGREAIDKAKAGAHEFLARSEPACSYDHAFKVLYVSELLECAVYAGRENGTCIFLTEADGRTACGIHDTKPRVCEKFPYYIGRYTDGRLLKEDSFCPSLRELAKSRP